MPKTKYPHYRGKAPRVQPSEPLFVRLCKAFVDNLGILLKTAFVFGAVLLVQNLTDALQEMRDAPPSEVPILATDSEIDRSERGDVETPADASQEPEVIESFMSEGVKRAFNCTFTEYREAHYEECVDEPSDVYRQPVDADDSGFMQAESAILYAGVVTASEAREL